MGLLEEKAAIRDEARSKRASIEPADRKALEDDLAERLYLLPAVRNARRIGVYQSFGSEACIDDLVRALRLLDRPPIIAYPVVHGEGLMTFSVVEYGENTEFMVNPTKIFPMGSVPVDRIVEPSAFDLLLVPGVAFDESCHRLGQGGGYYDRYLTVLNPDCLVVGIAFDQQIFEKIPTGVHDRRVDYVVTPTRIIQR